MRADFRVGTWLVEPSLNVISRNGTTVRLEPKVMEVLVCLAEDANKTLSKEKLLQTVWPDTFVSDDGLKHSISELRRVFEDDAREPRVIQTVAKRGYRLIAPVELVNREQMASPLSPQVGPEQSRRVRKRRVHGFAFGLVTVALIVMTVGTRSWWFEKSASSQIRSIAVLPLENLSRDPNQEYLSDGMTDALITDLAQISTLKVISRTSSKQYQQTKKSLPEIARELNVDGIVEGTVQRSGDQVRVSVQLIDGPSDRHIWATSYERSLSDVLTLERYVTEEVAGEIRARISTETKARLETPRTVNPKALEAYWQGKYYDRRYEAGLGDEGKRKAAVYFEQSIAADPNFAPAYVGLVDAHFRMSPTDEDLNIIQAAAEKAVALDPKLAEARIRLGEADWAAGRWAEAEQQFRMGIALNPNDMGSHSSLGNVLEIMGRLDEGLKEHQIAQALDPAYDHLSGTFYYRRQYDRAIEMLQRSMQSHPEAGYTHWSLAQNYLQKKMTSQWVTEVGSFMASVGFPEIAGHLQRAAALGGYRAALRQWAMELERLRARKQFYWPGVTAQAYAILGDKERAFYWLEDAYTHRRESYIDPYLWGRLRIDPGFDSLRDDPRYHDLLHRVGLPD